LLSGLSFEERDWSTIDTNEAFVVS
jgi:hypothetical protein